MAFNAVFESLCGTIVDAFVARARRVYSLMRIEIARGRGTDGPVEVGYCRAAAAPLASAIAGRAGDGCRRVSRAGGPEFAGIDLAAAVGVYGRSRAPAPQTLEGGTGWRSTADARRGSESRRGGRRRRAKGAAPDGRSERPSRPGRS